jgi:hypothetical protein
VVFLSVGRLGLDKLRYQSVSSSSSTRAFDESEVIIAYYLCQFSGIQSGSSEHCCLLIGGLSTVRNGPSHSG